MKFCSILLARGITLSSTVAYVVSATQLLSVSYQINSVKKTTALLDGFKSQMQQSKADTRTNMERQINSD